jgi:hypothetical protein
MRLMFANQLPLASSSNASKKVSRGVCCSRSGMKATRVSCNEEAFHLSEQDLGALARQREEGCAGQAGPEGLSLREQQALHETA